MRLLALLALLLLAPAPAPETAILLRPARVFDGVNPAPHPGWMVLVRGNRIAAVGPGLTAPPGARTIDLPGQTLLPGLVEGHSHLFLHRTTRRRGTIRSSTNRSRFAPRAPPSPRAPR